MENGKWKIEMNKGHKTMSEVIGWMNEATEPTRLKTVVTTDPWALAFALAYGVRLACVEPGRDVQDVQLAFDDSEGEVTMALHAFESGALIGVRQHAMFYRLAQRLMTELQMPKTQASE